MKVPTLLTQTELVAWFLIADTSKRCFSAVEAEMKSFDFTRAQWYLLTHVYYYDGLTQQELADSMDLTKSAAAKLIRKLELKNWVRRLSDERDGRIQRVYLIESVRPLVQALAKLAQAVLEPRLSLLPGAEMAALTATLRKLEDVFTAPAQPTANLLQARAHMKQVLEVASGKTNSSHLRKDRVRRAGGDMRK